MSTFKTVIFGKHVAEEKIKTEGHNMYEAFLIKNKRWFLDKRAA